MPIHPLLSTPTLLESEQKGLLTVDGGRPQDFSICSLCLAEPYPLSWSLVWCRVSSYSLKEGQ